MTPSSADLVVTDLHKAFGRQHVLAGLDLVVPAGRITAVLGPSGSGKTTLLRILAGFERPDRGKVAIGHLVLDDDRHHIPPERRRVGYVPQEGSLFPHLTVEANIAFGLPRALRRSAAVADLMESVGLAGLGRRYPHQLSGGQQQRVALARALAIDPRIVLLDEPFASLDANMRASVREEVRAILSQAGATSVLVTHDQDEALSMADQVAVIRSGTVAQVASPETLYAHPVDAELATFVGEANLLDGAVRDGAVETVLGALTLREPVAVPAGERVTVLVRPEQIDVRADVEAPGVPARVVSAGYHGHDAVVRLAPERTDCPEILARVLGHPPPPVGTAVSIRVRGRVQAWPAR